MKTTLLGLMVAVSGFCQSPAGQLRFDAVSIHPSASDARGGGVNLSPGRLNAKNQNLKDLVMFAWNLHDYQVSGGAGWMDADHYEVVANYPAETTNAQRAQMLQAMLAERFRLVVRHEQKEVSGYALVPGKNGPKLRTTDGANRGLTLGRNRPSGLRTMTGSGAAMSGLASLLSDVLGKPVEDKTGLAGEFDFSVEWLPDSMTNGRARVDGGKEPVAAEDQSGPSIFTALQESLGLKLDTGKVKVETIVIERAEKPSEN